jgi:hypothetical protein
LEGCSSKRKLRFGLSPAVSAHFSATEPAIPISFPKN